MSNEQNEENIKLKIILVGESGIGKTSIINRYHNNSFNENSLSTVSMNFISKKIEINKKKVIVDVWDTAGQEQYRSINKLFVKDADIVILVYDITTRKSFDDLDYWHNFINDELGQTPVLALAGNKMDLYEREEVREEEAEELANEWGAYFALLSAKEENSYIKNFFEHIIKLYLEKNENQEEKLFKNRSITLEEYNENSIEDNEGCCSNSKKDKNVIKDRNLKMIFLGENGVGKTYIVERILGKEISTQYEHTTKILKYKSIYKLGNNKTINVQIIDSNGDSISNNRDLKDYVKHGKIFFLVFDVNNKDSFYTLINFVEDIKKYYKKKKIILIVLGNKTKPSEDNNNCIKTEEAQKFANQIGGQYEMISTEDEDYFKNFINIYADKYFTGK
jgi:small GTP-binding protein